MISSIKSKFFLSSRLKSKSHSWNSSNGRNHKGKITSWQRGGGHKRLFREIDFKRELTEGIVVGLERDPNRSAFLARVFNPDTGFHSYILSSDGLKKGNVVRSDSDQRENGCSQRLQYITTGSYIYNLSLEPGSNGRFLRSSGSYGKLIRKTKNFAKIKLKSGQIKWFDINTIASLGVVSNVNARFVKLKKAGQSRWLGIRPNVRGVAMNPIDHPHGGGEGKTSGGRPSVTPWGKPTKGRPTSKINS